MKKFLVAMGIIFLILVTLVGISLGYLIYTGTRLDASSKEYVDTNVPAIVAEWSPDALLKRSSPQLQKIASEEQVRNLFSKLSQQFGPLRKYEYSKGEAHLSYTVRDGKVITASYIANATFQNGQAKIKIGLIQIDGAWMILSFYVNQPL